jgi:hypothetical protein
VATMVRHMERKATSPGTTKSPAQPTLPWLHLFSVVSPLYRVGNPLSIPEKPGNHINISPDPLRQSGVHYTLGVHQLGYARLEQIRVLPAREVTILSA